MIKYTEVVRKADKVEISTVSKTVATYDIIYDGKVYNFPVPLDDISTATLRRTDKPILFARWIRRAIEENTFQPAKLHQNMRLQKENFKNEKDG